MIRGLEEVTLNAWPSIQTILHDGWVLRFANGYTRRANSVNPLYSSTQALEAKIGECEALYRQQGLKTIFKITPAAQPSDLDETLDGLNYRFEALTSVQVLDLAGWEAAQDGEATLIDQVTNDWVKMYCEIGSIGEKYRLTVRQLLDLIALPKRLAVLHREGQIAACGLGVRQGTHIGLFDIVVDSASRRQGFGKRLVESLLSWGKRDGAQTAYLQVMTDNEPAVNLYAKLGFQEAYRYWYRVKG